MTVSFHGRPRRARRPPSRSARSTTTDLGIAARVVLVVGLEVGVVGAVGRVGQHVGRVPVDAALDRLGVRVDQQLGRVEAVALLGVVGAVDAVAVALAGADARQVAVPVVRGALGDARCAPRCRSSSNRHSSTRSACSEKSEKFVPSPSQVAPSGNGAPGPARVASLIAISAPGARGQAHAAVARASRSCVASATRAPARPGPCARRPRSCRRARTAPRRTRSQPCVLVELDAVGVAAAAARGARASSARVERRAASALAAARELGALEGGRVLRVGHLLAGELGEGGELAAAALAGRVGDLACRCGRRRTGTARARRTPRP